MNTSKASGLTLLELMIVIAIVAIIAAVGFPAYMTVKDGHGLSDGSIQWGVNGMTETRCIDGYKFVIGQRGYTSQILDSQGKGVPCK